MRALITGVSGFVGEHLAQYLRSRGMDVYGYDLRSSAIIDKTYIGQITDKDTLKQALMEINPNVVFHLAGLIKSDLTEELYKINLEGTASLFDALVELRQSPVFVLAGSSAVYGMRSGKRPISERLQIRPATHYALSKAAQELIAIRYFDTHQIQVKIVRMFNLLGPGQSADLACSAFARQIALAELNGKKEIITGNLDAQRDFVDVRDAVRAFELVAQKGKAGQVYNVCSGRAVAIRKCLDEMISMSPYQFKVRMDAEKIQKNDIPIQVGDSHKLNQIAGWRPQIKLKQSLSDLLNDWRQRVKSELE